MVSRDATFLEQRFIQKGGKGRQIELEFENSDQPTDQIDTDPSSQPTPINETSTVISCRSTRISHPLVRYGFLHKDEQELFTH